MDNALKLRVMFDMIDNFTKPLKNVLNSNKGLAQSLKQTRGELAELGKQQKAVASFREMRAGLAGTATKLGEAQAHVRQLAGSLRTFGPPSRQMIADLARARQAASTLRAEQKKQTIALEEMRGKLSRAGIDTRNLAEHERTLRSNIAQTTATMQAQTRQLELMADREKKLGAARGKMQAMQGVAGGMAIGGYAARSTGTHALGDLREALDETKKIQNERARITALGLGDQATKDAEKYVRSMKMMGVSTSDNMTLMRDALSIFADEHHAQMVMPTLAKMKFANEAMFGAEDAHANEEKFMNMLKVIELRGGTKDEATFRNEANMVQKVLSATGGRVGGDEWRNFIQTGGVAAKQMRQDAFYYQMEPLIQEMGGHAVGTGLMSMYNNVYQGKTTVKAARELVNLGLIKKEGIEYNKMGQVNHFKTGALKGSDLLKASPLEWLEKVFLPQLAAKGITDPDKIKDVIATVFTNRTAANLATTMVMQRDQIHKNEKLNTGAYGIDEMHKLASEQTPGKELDAYAKLRDLRNEIGERIAPMYNAALDQTRALAGKLLTTIQAHPQATKVVVALAAGFAALLAVVGTFTIVLAGVLGPLAVVRFSMTTLGIQGGILSRALGIGAAAWRMFGAAAMGAGRLLLTTPIGLYAAAFVAAALLIYRYWGPIKAFVGGALAAIGSALKPIGSALLATLQPLSRALAAAKPMWDWLGRALSTVGGWFGKLSEPAQTSADGLSAAAEAGRGFGAVLGAVLRAAFTPLTWLGRALGGLAGLFVEAMGDARAAMSGGLAALGALILNWSPLGMFYRAFAGVLSLFGVELPAKFTEFGGHLVDGLVGGISSGLGKVKDAISNMANSTVGWFKEKLGIHSPSRVFAALGGFVGEGAALGMQGEQRRVAKAALGLATAAVMSFGTPALAAPTTPLVRSTVPIDRRAPLAVASATPSAAASASPITINIYAQAGQDPHAIARAVEAALDRRERAKQSRIGSRLSD
ncbi:hypothetical protein [Burkholderia pseudomallei]|uniref:hypothetical protein n=1 Tax=Burkholderia pseudomallei TaxID=28450 RepID=UPI0008FF2E71|nr:hypothetical protein [Burkholderia pseudomallei]APD36810.1 hypothetical protein BK015_17755 [Burkholderia pseudomallei]ARK39695.1 hypothetical protein BOC60_05415 [Burkholderia pseudomallei]ARL58906.1 hypothetical protein BOC52_20245 [Burkholderia pseudomallei]ARL65322.1 hypothetical protein BOC53_17330 [Burkholderia pseudomallei]